MTWPSTSAEVARRRYPSSAIPASLRAIVLEMGQVAQRIVAKAGSVVATRDIVAAAEIERDDDVMDDLHRKLLRTILGGNWQEGLECAVDVVLIGRYYERFADHAVSVARSVIYLVTGEMPDPRGASACSLALVTLGQWLTRRSWWGGQSTTGGLPSVGSTHPA